MNVSRLVDSQVIFLIAFLAGILTRPLNVCGFCWFVVVSLQFFSFEVFCRVKCARSEYNVAALAFATEHDIAVLKWMHGRVVAP